MSREAECLTVLDEQPKEFSRKLLLANRDLEYRPE
jgi:hypothetical protein